MTGGTGGRMRAFGCHAVCGRVVRLCNVEMAVSTVNHGELISVREVINSIQVRMTVDAVKPSVDGIGENLGGNEHWNQLTAWIRSLEIGILMAEHARLVEILSLSD